ncbi:MAG TPA: hypothetical protein VHE34_09335 [Puia sp.]|uniref:hypothetical protein n=1 Tax=Puia sp. TaxID=2045100 RepID=UPI002BDB058D|nr:hypothetical protein [Puia sp.]HVU95416.1 hypothetical protein [Puia sp.]
MPEDLFLSSNDPGSNHYLVVEGDNLAVWAYLLNVEDEKILAHGLVCSRMEPDEELKDPIDRTKPPPLIKRFASSHSIIPDLKEEQMKIEWINQQAKLYIDGILYLVMEVNTRRARCKAVSKPGRYGFPMED